MTDDARLFAIEETGDVPLLPTVYRRRSEGDARHRGEYPDEWEECSRCGGGGTVDGPWFATVLGGATVQHGGVVYEAGQEIGVEYGDHPTLRSLEAQGLVRFHCGTEKCPDCLGMGKLSGRVRLEAGHRCLRCKHPYIPKRDAQRLGVEPSWRGDGWSSCDRLCEHGGPYRYRDVSGRWREGSLEPDASVIKLHLLNRTPIEAAWRVLTVHHADCDKSNVRWWNLLALCQRCHLEIQGKVVMERVYPFEHSEWFKPFVAGYYAHVYLCRCGHRQDEHLTHKLPAECSMFGCECGDMQPLDLTREQVEERMDELLGLELIVA